MRAPAAPLSSARIVRRYYGVWLVYALAGGFLAGVYPLFLRSRGLNQFEINSVLAMYFAVTFLLDVPTGAFADAIGRRLAFVLGCALRCLGFGLYFLSHTYVLFLVAETIDAIGTTFCNGAIDAWGVDALDEAGFEGTKDRLFSRVSQLSSLGFMVTALIGAFVGQVDIAWPWLLGAGGFVISGLSGMLLHERPRLASGGGHRAMREAIRGRIGASIRRGFGIRSVRLLSFAEAIILGLWAPYWLEWPLLFSGPNGGRRAATRAPHERSPDRLRDPAGQCRVRRRPAECRALIALPDERLPGRARAAGAQLVQRAPRARRAGDDAVVSGHDGHGRRRGGAVAGRSGRRPAGHPVRLEAGGDALAPRRPLLPGVEAPARPGGPAMTRVKGLA